VALLLLVSVAVLALTKRTRLPFTVVLVVVGMALSGLPGPLPFERMHVSPDLILFVFLPTLVFESAFNLDARQLRHNLAAVLILAIPGLLLSTGIIGLVVHWGIGLPLPVALLLGAILSATDPVAVIAIFRRICAPRRLLTVVEGESLFNDAVAILLSRILIAVVAAGTLPGPWEGIGMFAGLFLGGLLVGAGLGLVTGYLLGRVESDAAIEITLTTVAAYLSFLLAEEVLHVSGVMATVGAGLVLGGWGRLRISPGVRAYLEQFWEYAAFVANALIFLLVGLSVDLSGLAGAAAPLVWVVVGMLVSRAAVVYGLMPLVGRLPRMHRIAGSHQTVMVWGGLRGAVGLALVLSLPEFPQRDLLVALVTGAVLFTLLVQGLTLEPLMRWLGLDTPPLADRFDRLETALSGVAAGRERIPGLRRGGLFSSRIGERLERETAEHEAALRAELGRLQSEELDRAGERRLLYLRALSEERSAYVEMLRKGHLGERAVRALFAAAARREEGVRAREPLVGAEGSGRRRLDRHLADGLQRVGLATVAERLRRVRVVTDYEEAWGGYHAAETVLEALDRIAPEAVHPDVQEEVRAYYCSRQEMEQGRLDRLAAQFPEFVAAMQLRLGRQLLLVAEEEAVDREEREGTLQPGVAEKMRQALRERRHALHAAEAAEFGPAPEELLRMVPFCRDMPEEVVRDVVERLHRHTVPEGEEVVHQGEEGHALFLVARGVLRVSREDGAGGHDLASLMAGDFFGEMALLGGERRNATIRAVTPALLYELRRPDMEAVLAEYPRAQAMLEQAARERGAALAARG